LEELLTSSNLIEFFESYIANQSIPEINNLLANHIANHTNSKNQDEHSQQAMLDWDFNNFLPDDLLVKVDRATMYHSIECREPFLDHRIAEFSFRMPIELKIKNGIGKYPLRQLLLRHFPASFFERKKQGFSIPVFSWFKSDLDILFHHYISDERLNAVDILNKEEVLREYKKYQLNKKRNKQYNIEKMWRILSFMMWWDNVHKS
jgi:asparagine synthase (glutamine-hydrolysing)